MKNTIAIVLKERRKSAHLSVKDVLNALHEKNIDVSDKAVYSWENGYRQPDADKFLVLCEIYGINSFTEITSQIPEVEEENPHFSYEAQQVALGYDRADKRTQKIVWTALEDFMKTPVPAMATRRIERTAADNNSDTDTWHIRDMHWRETLSRWMKEHPNASVVSGDVPEWVEFNLIRAVYEEDLPGWSKEKLRERAERMFQRPWTGKVEILFPSELALFRIDSEAAERRRKSGKDYSRFNESKTINLSCFRCPMVILCNQRREKTPFAELKRRAPSIYAAAPDMAHIFNAEECPVYSILNFSQPEISEWEIPKFSVDENGKLRLPAGNSAPFAIFSMINPVFQAELDKALKPVGNDTDDLEKT